MGLRVGALRRVVHFEQCAEINSLSKYSMPRLVCWFLLRPLLRVDARTGRMGSTESLCYISKQAHFALLCSTGAPTAFRRDRSHRASASAPGAPRPAGSLPNKRPVTARSGPPIPETEAARSFRYSLPSAPTTRSLSLCPILLSRSYLSSPLDTSFFVCLSFFSVQLLAY